MNTRAAPWLVMVLLCVLAGPACAGCLSNKPLRGVNMAGAEFNGTILPGQVFKNYTYPARPDLEYFADLGANTIRLPVRWERLQRTLNGPLDPGEVRLVRQVLEVAHARDLCVIVDLHNFGTYARQKLGSEQVPVSAFVDFWVRMQQALPDVDHVAFGLMNEPAHIDLDLWAEASQRALGALRDAGAKHLVLLAGGAWSGAHDWMQFKGKRSNATALAPLRDPLKRTLIEVHQYADSDYSGSKRDCLSPERMKELLDRVRDWAAQSGQRLFLGEFGVADTPECLRTLQAQLDAVRDPPWAGWTYWAAGAWWGASYLFNVHPIPGVVHGQTDLLQKEWTRP